MSVDNLHISISAEKLFTIGPLDVSNSIVTSLIASALILIFAYFAKASMTSKKRPKGLQNFAEFIVQAFYNLIFSITHNHKKTRDFLPLVISFFLFILINNWLGLFPGIGSVGLLEKAKQAVFLEKRQLIQAPRVYATSDAHGVKEETLSEIEELQVEDEHASEAEEKGDHGRFVPLFRPGTADLNTTLALAISTVFFIQFLGIKHLGLSYFKKFFNFSNPIKLFIGFLELISEFSKILSFGFRLFGNIFAGEVLITVISSLVPLIAPIPFYILELFVGFIQALIFSMLSIVFYNTATVSHDDH